MNSKLFSAFAFVLGAAAGSFVTKKVLDKKYGELLEKEIEDIKRAYSSKKDETNVETKEEKTVDPGVDEYESMLVERGYVSKDNMTEVKGGVERVSGRPYVIRPEELDDEDYPVVELMYWADGVLTNEYDEVIEDVDEVVGKDSLTHFGEYEPDTVYVRDDEEEVDYEIRMDTRKYSDVIRDMLSRTEG